MELELTAENIFFTLLGIVGTIVTMFFTGTIKEIFSRRDRRYKHTINVANNVQKLVIEGSTIEYWWYTDEIEVNKVKNNLKGINPQLSTDIDMFLSNWKLISSFVTGKKKTNDFKKDVSRITKENEVIGERLLDWSNKIRAKS